MKVIKEHIKTGSFKTYYLLYGSEEYLKKLYRDKLRTAIIGDGSDMNYSYFEGKGLDLKEISQIAQTLPFFSDKRLVIIENSGLFKASNEFAAMVKIIPDSTFFIFVESEVDKRNKLFKMVKDKGIVCEMNGLDERNLKLFTVSLLKHEKKKITEKTVNYLLDKSGSDMENICNEVEKIICFTMGREVVTQEDIDAVVTVQITGKIFQMIEAIGLKQQRKALYLYYDLLAVREKPLSILFLITRHFNILLQVKDLKAKGQAFGAIGTIVGIPPFTVKKYIAQAENFTTELLKKALEYCMDIEGQIKTGRMLEKIGVELLIITFSKK
jgi:DNA polymerase-3 subunit delta